MLWQFALSLRPMGTEIALWGLLGRDQWTWLIGILINFHGNSRPRNVDNQTNVCQFILLDLLSNNHAFVSWQTMAFVRKCTFYIKIQWKTPFGAHPQDQWPASAVDRENFTEANTHLSFVLLLEILEGHSWMPIGVRPCVSQGIHSGVLLRVHSSAW